MDGHPQAHQGFFVDIAPPSEPRSPAIAVSLSLTVRLCSIEVPKSASEGLARVKKDPGDLEPMACVGHLSTIASL